MQEKIPKESKGRYTPSGQAESRTAVKMKIGRDRTVLRGKDPPPWCLMFVDRVEMKDDNDGDLWGMRKRILRRGKIARQSYKNIQQVRTCVHIAELMLAEKLMWISF